jgi:hypothetical protein
MKLKRKEKSIKKKLKIQPTNWPSQPNSTTQIMQMR